MFANDTAITTQHINLTEAAEQLENSVNQITNCLTKWCININYQKRETKIFIPKRIIVPTEITMVTYKVPWKSDNEVVKYLGV